MKNELLPLIGAKVVCVTETEIRFDNGSVVDFHPYETYVYHVPKEDE